MQKVKFDTIVSAHRIKQYMQKEEKYTWKRLKKDTSLRGRKPVAIP